MKQIIWMVSIIMLATIISVSTNAAETQTSIEVGFFQQGEPEPHLLVVAGKESATVYQLPELPQKEDLKVAKAPRAPLADDKGVAMSLEQFKKRFTQAVDEEGFFSNKVTRKRGKCGDQYILRIQHEGRFKERRGCTYDPKDPFAGFAQLIFRDAFLLSNKGKSNH